MIVVLLRAFYLIPGAWIYMAYINIFSVMEQEVVFEVSGWQLYP